MRVFLMFILVFIFNMSFSQTVKELEHELSFYKSGEEWGNKKDIAHKLLGIDKSNEEAINYLVRVYRENNQLDSINGLFDALIKSNPKNPGLYLIRAEESNARLAGLTFLQRIDYLKKAKELDQNNVEATYGLGKIYYELFLKEYNNSKEKSAIVQSAKKAVEYFADLRSINLKFNEAAKYPLIQLYNYLGEQKKSKALKKDTYQFSYFPISSLMELPKNWDTNYSVNVLVYVSNMSVSGIESAIFSIDWYSKHLRALNEPVLSDTLTSNVYRFTYLRTFDNPIVIRIENKSGSISIHWKVSDGAGGYEPGKIVENQSKELTIKEWELIESKVHAINFWKLPTSETEISGTDGSQWILEGKTLEKYNVVDKWCGGKIESVCKEMLELTDLKLEKDKIY